MDALGIRQRWTLTSTGRGTPVNAKGYPTWWTFYFATNATSTATINVETAMSTSVAWATLGSRTLSTNDAAVVRVEGPLIMIAPRIEAMSSGTVTVEVVGN